MRLLECNLSQYICMLVLNVCKRLVQIYSDCLPTAEMSQIDTL